MKIVVFDFDGTITYKSPNLWKAIWTSCGFDVGAGSIYEKYYKDYKAGKYDYKEWCDKTCTLFRERNFSHDKLLQLAKNFNIIDGLEETVKYLKGRGVKLHILSGSIIEGIKAALGESEKYFDNICANTMIFDKDGIVEEILSTKFDYVGKAEYIKMLCDKFDVLPEDIVFVGNDDNDDFVFQSGCHTICLNPNKADYQDKEKWHFLIEKSSNFKDLLPIFERL